jgi:DNA-binding NarL/FixJ family response regulator
MSRRVVIVVPDLFFVARILTAGKSLGVAIDRSSADTLVADCRRGPPDLVIVDLHGDGDPLAAIRALRADPLTRGVRVVGFHSHVDTAIRDAALAAGVDEVLPRSAFTVRLALLLRG